MDITGFVVSQRDEALIVGDYNTYRAQSSRRLHTLRKRLGQTTPRGRKYAPKPTVTAEDISKNFGYAHLLLLSAERAWANSMHMKSVHSTDPSAKGITGSTRRHIITRLHKSTAYAKQLVLALQDQAVSQATKFDLLEARAYLASLSGALWMEKQRWEECLRQYSLARVIYVALGQTAKKDAFRDLLAGTIDPSIRYSAYQLKLSRTRALSSLAIEYFPSDNELRAEVQSIDTECLVDEGTKAETGTAGSTQALPQNITWRSRSVPIVDASISQALAAAAAAESVLTSWLAESAGRSASAKEKAAAYDNVIIASQDAVDAAKTAIDELSGEGVDPGDSRMQALQITRTAVNYALIGWRVGRNRVLAGEQDGLTFSPEQNKAVRKSKGGAVPKYEGTGGKLARLREQVVLYDAVLQSVDFIKELPGVAGDASLVTELGAKRNYFQALRCLAIGRSHGLVSQTKNALALFSRALDLVSASGSVPGSSAEGPPQFEVSAEQVQTAQSLLQGLVWQYRGIVDIENQESELNKGRVNAAAAVPLVERLNEYPAGEVDLNKVVSYPPKMEPVPVKPLFLDVAWNYIDYPRAGKRAVTQETAPADAPVEEEKKETKRGWFGFGRG